MFPLFRNNLHLDEHFVGGGSFRQGKPRNEESSVFGNGFDDHGWLRLGDEKGNRHHTHIRRMRQPLFHGERRDGL